MVETEKKIQWNSLLQDYNDHKTCNFLACLKLLVKSRNSAIGMDHQYSAVEYLAL
jgi:hypothetical protein